MGESRTCEFTDQLISLFFGSSPQVGLGGQVWGFKWCNKCIVYDVSWRLDPCKLTLVPHLVSRDKFGDPPPGAASQPLWAGIENTGQSVSHSVLTPALRVPKTHLEANLGVRNLCGRILELFVFEHINDQKLKTFVALNLNFLKIFYRIWVIDISTSLI